MKRFFLMMIFFFCCLSLKAVGVDALNILDDNHWTPNLYQYPNNMTVIGVVEFNGEEQRSNFLEVGVFCGEECRGSAVAKYNDKFDRYFLFMMVYGNNGDSLNLRCYNHNLNVELEVEPKSYLKFTTNETLGNVNAPYVFSFEVEYEYYVSVDVMPKEGGVVVGGGAYNEYDTCYLEIVSNKGYKFEALLENGDTLTKQSHYSFEVLSDRRFEAVFSEMTEYYKISVEASPAGGGTITGAGQYLDGEMCRLHVTAASGYKYEGLYENGRLVTKAATYSFMPDDDHHFVAEFSVKKNHYQITAKANPKQGGVVIGAGKYFEGETCNLSVKTNSGYVYEGLYEKGELVTMDTVFSFVPQSNRHFVAEFSVQETYYEITAEVNPAEGGAITGMGQYLSDETCILKVTPNPGYTYKGLYENGKLVTASAEFYLKPNYNRHFVAKLEMQEFEVTLISNPEEGGTTSGEGFYLYGDTVYAVATPNEDYVFQKWINEDGEEISTDSEYIFEAKENVLLIANFEYTGGGKDKGKDKDKDKEKEKILVMSPNPTSDFIVVEKEYCYGDIMIFNLYGKLVLKQPLGFKDDTIYVGNLPQGTYIVAFYDDLNRYRISKLVVN